MSDFPPGPYSQVQWAFSTANQYATAHSQNLSSFLDALNSTLYAPPSISVSWSSIAPPKLPEVPEPPDLRPIELDTPPDRPEKLCISPPNITIPEFYERPPHVQIPSPPNISYPAAPQVPTPRDVAIPSPPTISLPSPPTYLSIETVSFDGINLREGWLDKLEDIPDLQIIEPTPYSHSVGSRHSSSLLTALQQKIEARLSGGTGLDAAVEQAIWDRARSRETKTALSNEAEILRQSEALGFSLPPGVLAAQLRQAQREYYDKVSDLSREIAIKQAELEQQNLKDAITSGIQLESQLLEYSYQIERICVDNAKNYADNAIQIYNGAVEHYKALLTGYQTYAQAYDTIIRGQLAKVDVFKARLAAEQTKAEVNKALVEQYKAEIDAGIGLIQIYQAQVDAAKTLVDLERTRIEAGGEQIRAYIASVNAETAKIEAYKAQVQGEVSKIEIFRSQAEAYASLASAKNEKAKADIQYYNALVAEKKMEWDAYIASYSAETEKVRALSAVNSSIVEGYKASLAAIESQARMLTAQWGEQIKQYEATQNLAIQAGRINSDNVINTNNARLDAAKTAAQIYAQLTASAYSMINASASISGSGSSVSTWSESTTTSTIHEHKYDHD